MNRILGHILKMSGKDFSKRKDQVFDEDVEEIKESDYEPAMIHVQSHAAKRAGDHYDYRLVVGRSNRALSFASKKGLPLNVGQPTLMVQQPTHTKDYSTWSGEIPDGEYGAGKVEHIHSWPAVYKSQGARVDLTVSKGPMRGRYTLLKQKGKNWLAIKHKPMDYHWEERVKFGRGTPEMLDHPEFIAEKKHDGVGVIARFDSKKGVAIVARAKNVMGEVTPKENHVPWIRDTKVPSNYSGMVLRGELVHPNHPFKVTSSIILSDPHSAIEAQKKVGKLLFVPFEVIKGPKGSDISMMSYNQKRAILNDFVASLNHEFIKGPESDYANKRMFFETLVGAGGEGVVLKHILTGEPFKLKKSQDFDLKIVGFSPGEGKYAGRGIGAFKVCDKYGRPVALVGTGLSDQLRQDAHKNPSQYLHKLMKVEALETTEDGKLREPRFKGWTVDKNVADEVLGTKLATQNPMSQIQARAVLETDDEPGDGTNKENNVISITEKLNRAGRKLMPMKSLKVLELNYE